MKTISELIRFIEEVCAEIHRLSKKQYFRGVLQEGARPKAIGRGGFAKVYALSPEWIVRQQQELPDPDDPHLSVSKHSGFASPIVHRASDGREIQAQRGEDLMDFLLKNNFPSFRDRLKIVGQILDAVYQLHKAGWVHGDLKPENILIKRQGKENRENPLSGFRITLCDCDGAVHCEEVEEEMTSPAFFTAIFMPPEALLQGGMTELGYLPKWDAYSVGVTLLYVCFPAFARDYVSIRETLTSREILYKKLGVIRQPLRTQRDLLRQYELAEALSFDILEFKLWRLVSGLLQFHPENRSSVTAARVDFQVLLEEYNEAYPQRPIELLSYASNDQVHTNSEAWHLLSYLKNHLEAWQHRETVDRASIFAEDLRQYIQQKREALHRLIETGLDDATTSLYSGYTWGCARLRRKLEFVVEALREIFPPEQASSGASEAIGLAE